MKALIHSQNQIISKILKKFLFLYIRLYNSKKQLNK